MYFSLKINAKLIKQIWFYSGVVNTSGWHGLSVKYAFPIFSDIFVFQASVFAALGPVESDFSTSTRHAL